MRRFSGFGTNQFLEGIIVILWPEHVIYGGAEEVQMPTQQERKEEKG